MQRRHIAPLLLAAALACAGATTAAAQSHASPGSRAPAAKGGASGHKAPRTPPPGRWDCRDELVGPLRTMGFFVLGANGTYRYLDKADKAGRYRYDAATGVIEWLTGPYGREGGSDDHFRGFFEVTSTGRPMITMRLVSKGVAYADADYCFLRTG